MIREGVDPAAIADLAGRLRDQQEERWRLSSIAHSYNTLSRLYRCLDNRIASNPIEGNSRKYFFGRASGVQFHYLLGNPFTRDDVDRLERDNSSFWVVASKKVVRRRRDKIIEFFSPSTISNIKLLIAVDETREVRRFVVPHARRLKNITAGPRDKYVTIKDYYNYLVPHRYDDLPTARFTCDLIRCMHLIAGSSEPISDPDRLPPEDLLSWPTTETFLLPGVF